MEDGAEYGADEAPDVEDGAEEPEAIGVPAVLITYQ